MLQRWLFLTAIALCVPSNVVAGDKDGTGASGFYWDWGSFTRDCGGDCALSILGGRQTTVAMSPAFGIADFTQGEFGFVPAIPFRDWPWTDSRMIAATYSRRIASFGHARVGEVISIKAEVGIGQRTGSQTETEIWGAGYIYWHLFPWNRWVDTSVGISTGLNWATGISDFEVHRSGNDEGSQLLHYLSPEITLSLPQYPDIEVVARFHHRSGGSDMFGPNSIFNNTGGGSQYVLIGTRFWF
ncbi:hypothetical protein SAMN04488005_1031 [Yoonia tamlensis]|uniref:Uncharacterized protein n=1 Tax=Yoonia tamlensis TaxID=390270 RepID=A0A1I6G424_9RHOB|nr:hypothetical protein [Yoonia tamlensis]SFR36860.1 hypothetical protein SAMN04488005_1031 [Yoonia tamlensis]